ncbi:glycosyltransferase [Caulobacter sp. NIBR1757]|uniref:glycosyltransferase n=1 Tax=Caulobacter sp. NIBR1757 TaxID=3016000 RepID=UPI0022EFE9B3|nr:glycosyltransferase [Caulobacter sp. NIBR1757]
MGQYELLRAREAAEAGGRVHLIGLGEKPGVEEEAFADGRLTITRLAAKRPNRASLLTRALWAIRTNFRLLGQTARTARTYPDCEIKVTGSPPFISYMILFWRLLNPRHTITYRITDFYPETAFAAGKARFLRPMTPLIHALRRRADRIEALSWCQKARLIESGVPESNIEIVRDTSPVRLEPGIAPAPRPFADDACVLLYSGNLGFAHDWETFAEAYRIHVQTGPNRVRLWLNATGVGVERLRAYCETHGLPIHISGPVPLDELPAVLMAADAHLILLGDPFWGYVFPSKTYACLDSHRPCLFVGPAESDVHALLMAQPDTNHSVRNGDIDGAVAALNRLSDRR